MTIGVEYFFPLFHLVAAIVCLSVAARSALQAQALSDKEEAFGGSVVLAAILGVIGVVNSILVMCMSWHIFEQYL